MKILKESGNYLRNQTLKNLAKAIACLLLVSGIGLFLFVKLVTSSVGILEEALAVFALFLLGTFFIYLRKYHVYLGGWNGEKRVVEILRTSLGNDYFLINNVRFRDGQGDIDHIVLGPNGIFSIETKNWRGKITCNGDSWQRKDRPLVASSPSEQAKKNAFRVRHAIEKNKKISFNSWIEPILVFTNKHAELYLNNPTVAVLKLQQLPGYITTYEIHSGAYSYSRQQLEQIGKEIAKQTH
ncbi:MAG TPA: nuclease-related domain-containing protein [Candidatus Nanoarchaeia archaeon]|nr:nuclease-related domain-containing protein [Candidatus Nanoarchaeia archaeon]